MIRGFRLRAVFFGYALCAGAVGCNAIFGICDGTHDASTGGSSSSSASTGGSSSVSSASTSGSTSSSTGVGGSCTANGNGTEYASWQPLDGGANVPAGQIQVDGYRVSTVTYTKSTNVSQISFASEGGDPGNPPTSCYVAVDIYFSGKPDVGTYSVVDGAEAMTLGQLGGLATSACVVLSFSQSSGDGGCAADSELFASVPSMGKITITQASGSTVVLTGQDLVLSARQGMTLGMTSDAMGTIDNFFTNVSTPCFTFQ